MENIIELTNRYLLSEKINTLPVTHTTVSRLIEKNGFYICSYNEASEVICNLSLGEYIKSKDAVTVIVQDLKIVMYRNTLSNADRLFCLAHELGHIVLTHIPCGKIAKSPCRKFISEQENEADAFAYQFLAPLSILRACHADYDDIIRITSLSERYAESIFAALSLCHLGESDRELFEQFSTFISGTIDFKRNVLGSAIRIRKPYGMTFRSKGQ